MLVKLVIALVAFLSTLSANAAPADAAVGGKWMGWPMYCAAHPHSHQAACNFHVHKRHSHR